jgi:hypothetical protein
LKFGARSDSHIVELHDGSAWQIVPGDLDLTLRWLPTAEIQIFGINDEVASHGLVNCDDGSVVLVRPKGERWPEATKRRILRDY